MRGAGDRTRRARIRSRDLEIGDRDEKIVLARPETPLQALEFEFARPEFASRRRNSNSVAVGAAPHGRPGYPTSASNAPASS